jgi:hypothetical protein
MKNPADPEVVLFEIPCYVVPQELYDRLQNLAVCTQTLCYNLKKWGDDNKHRWLNDKNGTYRELAMVLTAKDTIEQLTELRTYLERVENSELPDLISMHKKLGIQFRKKPDGPGFDA